MPEAPLTPSDTGQLPLIDSVFQPTQNEFNRQKFVSALRKFVLVDLQGQMHQAYDDLEVPAYTAAHGHAPVNGREADKAMEKNPISRFYSSIRYNTQEMVWESVREPIERALPEMIDISRRAAHENPSGGSLRLDADLKVPRYVAEVDVHLIPGSFHTEFTADDVAQGAIAAFGAGVFSGGLVWRRDKKGRFGGVGESVAAYLSRKYPDFKPRRILDMATTSGKNLFPYKDVYPEAEAYGIDVGAPLLRFGHAQAEGYGIPVHFSQQNAESTDFADGSMDLIVSCFFFHEIPVKVTQAILKECHRLLAPGGFMVHMELPPQKDLNPYMNFFWDWDTINNNEPTYTAYRSQNPTALTLAAGFEKRNCFEMTIPNFATFGEERFNRFVKGELEAPAHGSGGWYVFGARK